MCVGAVPDRSPSGCCRAALGIPARPQRDPRGPAATGAGVRVARNVCSGSSRGAAATRPDTESPASAAGRAVTLGARIPKAFWQFADAVRAELSDPLTPVLALGSVATAMLGSPIDAVMVGTVLTGNSMLAAAQRLRAETRLNHLLAQQIPPARKVAIRPDGTRSYTQVIAERLRPGDLIEVRSNEVVPADARVVEDEDLEVDESSLTGESLPVQKQTDATPGADLADRRCMLYAGTHVVAGRGIALVTAVGADTQQRRAAELASGELPIVGLQHQLSQLTKRAFPVTASGARSSAPLDSCAAETFAKRWAAGSPLRWPLFQRGCRWWRHSRSRHRHGG
ncbi:E1-E2 ATPase family protein [Mycobacterium xenopi 3993]|nr:E1-E2 ATPase family protein [Mycobacterium xenopi 3993]